MANGFVNLGHNVLNYAQHPAPFNNNTSPISCRLCNQRFTSTQALLAHIESHMACEEVAIRRLYSPQHVNSQMQLASHHFPPTPIMGDGRIFQSPPQHMALPRRNPFSNATSQVGSSSQPIRQMAPWNVINDDGTKAYLMQLEKPIKKDDFIDLVNVDDDNLDGQTLDLELKL
ncbi:hypothetical protein VNO77_14173 [Canavalia gladiata]|uniref:C2H2-type domain-containing protein n=1 Tax=Canavalia gladiata TaxID=3824 RepID=A0AAN9LYN3_CANGL